MDELYQQIKCCVSDDEHFIDEPILIACGHNACRKCIENLNEIQTSCRFCKTIHNKEDMMKMQIVNPSASLLLITNLKNINEDLKLEDRKSLKGFFLFHAPAIKIYYFYFRRKFPKFPMCFIKR
jgi:hypothetical protein